MTPPLTTAISYTRAFQARQSRYGYPMSNTHRLKSLVALELEINNRITEFAQKSAKNKNYNQKLKFIQIFLAAFTTLIIAINTKYAVFTVSVIAMTTSALAGVASQIMSTFMYQERMAMEIATTCALRELACTITMDKNKEEDDASRKITLEHIDRYQERYQQIVNTANGQWQKSIQNNTSKK
ncbi:SLATT domain-containing protein [Pseudomonas tolaasii]|uniref:SLATT domain-containing protein n=1 Tax=Pseudomonas tolaasii TaxID=29442 RepID=UPI001C5DEEF7|nr:SLATT domain-containing protein [Pseudomonas tolaasii]MBW4792312.1 SLATT domain-containing protein [Pseudomonas tolaasii]